MNNTKVAQIIKGKKIGISAVHTHPNQVWDTWK